MAAPDETRTRLALVEERTTGQAAEIQRMRERLHLLEGDRAAIRLAVTELRRMRNDMPKVARDAAERACELALDNRDAQDRQRRQESRSVLGTVLQAIGAGTAVIGVGFMFVELVLN